MRLSEKKRMIHFANPKIRDEMVGQTATINYRIIKETNNQNSRCKGKSLVVSGIVR